MFFTDHFNSLRGPAVSSAAPNQKPGQRDPKGKKLSGTPMFLLRFFIFFIVLGAAWGIYELELSFQGRNIGLLVVMLPLGWAAAMVLSAWLVGMLYYDKDDNDGE